jgi:hypothetical protein
MKHLLLTATLIASLAAAGTASANRWPRYAEGTLISACVQQGASGAYCICGLRWLEARYTAAQANSLALNRPLQYARVIDQVRSACGA